MADRTLTARLAAPRRGVRAHASAPVLLSAPAVVLLVGVFAMAMLTLGEYSLHRFDGGVSSTERSLDEWRAFLSDAYQWRLVWNTLQLGLLTVAGCLLVGYPTAVALHRLTSPIARSACYFMLFAPLLTSVVARTYGWSLILGDAGLVNAFLDRLGVIDEPLRLMYDRPAVLIGLIHILLPFVVLPVLSSLRQVHEEMLEAAGDLGAPGWRRFTSVTLPLSLPGLMAGAQLCFALAISTFATPSLLGGGRVQVLATGIYSDVATVNWPRAAIGSYVLLALALLALAGFATIQRRLGRGR